MRRHLVLALGALALAVTATGAPPPPLRFEENAGQWDAPLRYVARGGDYSIAVTATELVFSASDAQTRMQFVGAGTNVQAAGLDPLTSTANYFIGDDTNRWRSGVRTFGRVRCEELYSSIAATYEPRDGTLHIRFDIAPGGDPASIQFRYPEEDPGPPEVSARQERDGSIQAIPCHSVRATNGTWRIEVGEYDRENPLIIE